MSPPTPPTMHFLYRDCFLGLVRHASLSYPYFAYSCPAQSMPMGWWLPLLQR